MAEPVSSTIAAAIAAVAAFFAPQKIQAVLFGVWGGTTSYFYSLLGGQKFSFKNFLIEMTGAAFFGYLACYIGLHFTNDVNIICVFSGMAGLGGSKNARLIFAVIERSVVALAEKLLWIKIDANEVITQVHKEEKRAADEAKASAEAAVDAAQKVEKDLEIK